jgi:hypothetical protein
MNRLLNWLERNGLRRGLKEGSGPWMTVGVSAAVLRMALRAVARMYGPEVVYRTELRPGERLEIITSGKNAKRRRGA